MHWIYLVKIYYGHTGAIYVLGVLLEYLGVVQDSVFLLSFLKKIAKFMSEVLVPGTYLT